jgi:hypothetical protein
LKIGFSLWTDWALPDFADLVVDRSYHVIPSGEFDGYWSLFVIEFYIQQAIRGQLSQSMFGEAHTMKNAGCVLARREAAACRDSIA